MGKKTARITVRITPDMKKDLEDIAATVPDRSANDLARIYLNEGIARDKPAAHKTTKTRQPPSRKHS